MSGYVIKIPETQVTYKALEAWLTASTDTTSGVFRVLVRKENSYRSDFKAWVLEEKLTDFLGDPKWSVREKDKEDILRALLFEVWEQKERLAATAEAVQGCNYCNGGIQHGF